MKKGATIAFGVLNLLLLISSIQCQSSFGDCINDCLIDCLESIDDVPTMAPTTSPVPVWYSPPPRKSPPPPKIVLSPPPPKVSMSPPPPKQAPLAPNTDMVPPPPPPPPPPPMNYDDVGSPPPPKSDSDAPGGMTQSFPLGSCSPINVPIPYNLTLDEIATNRICFKINLSPDYIDRCAQKKIMPACNIILSQWAKISFWYKNTDECGWKFTQKQGHLDKFIWWVKSWQNNKVESAGTYGIFPPNADKAFAAGTLNLFKYVHNKAKKQSSIEVVISRGTPFVRKMDATADGYRLCLRYNEAHFDLPHCISKGASEIKYSFVHPKINYCSVGSVDVAL